MKTLLLPFLLSAAPAVLAQTAPVENSLGHPATQSLSGTVRDADGQPLPGVNVFLKTTLL